MLRRPGFALVATLLGLALCAMPASATVIGGGWSVDDPAGITYPVAVGGTGTSGDPFTFNIKMAAAVGAPKTIKFTHDNVTDVGGQTYFNVTLIGENTGAVAWTDFYIAVVDTTVDAIPVEADTVGHPERAHLHRSAWSEAGSDRFKCVDAYCGGNGRYDMNLGLKAANPLLSGQTSGDEKILRLHDIDETGGNAMKFELTLLAIPEPSSALLLACGLLGLRTLRRRPAI